MAVAAMTWSAGMHLPPMQGDPCARPTSSTWFAASGSRMASRDGRRGEQRSLQRGGSSLSRSATSLLQRRQAIPLPPIMKQSRPATFEDMYSAARLRVAKKSAVDRDGGRNPLLLRSSGSLPDFPLIGGSRRLGASCQESMGPGEAEALHWAASALASEPGGEEGAHRPGSGAEDLANGVEEAAMLRQASLRRDSKASRRPSRQTRGDLSAGPSEQELREDSRDDLAAGSSKTSRASLRHNSSMRSLRASISLRRSVSMQRRRSSMLSPGRGDPALIELIETVAARAEGRTEGFSEKETLRLQTAFNRFKIPGENDLYTEDLFGLLNYLGHVMTQEEGISEILREVTTYDYMDFSEFLTFMEKFTAFEREEFRKKFDEFDVDNSGEISMQELRGLTKALGFMPLRQMMHEAIEVVDQDRNGLLNFDELCTFLAVYSHRECFTHEQVSEFRRQFDFWAVDGTGLQRGQRLLPPEALSDAMVQVFGLQVTDFTSTLGEQLASGQGLQKSTFDRGGGEPEMMNFNEFLIFARKVRENEHSVCCKENPDFVSRRRSEEEEFSLADMDHSGGISEAELRRILQNKKYTPLRSVIDEIMEEVQDDEWDPEFSELDFDEFFDFMMVFCRRDGFLRAELEELRTVYERFDEDNSGEVSAMECAAVFRHVGYRVTLEDIRDHVAEVDANGSGQLDFREFLRLMRLYREKELAKIQAAFEVSQDWSTNMIPPQVLTEVLRSLGNDPPYPERPWGDEKAQVSFDELVDIVDACRSEFVKKERKKAGFSDEDLENFENIYHKFDTNKNGTIDTNELQNVLKALGWEPKTREEQELLMMKIDQAKGLAREAGVEDVGEDGSASIKFWSFVQLARMFRTERDKAEEENILFLQKELRFTEGETEEFRQVFRVWAKRMQELEDTQAATDELSRDGVRRLVRSLGISVSPANAAVLDAQVQTLDEEGRLEGAMLKFDGFLRLMRWLLDTDFAGINDAAAAQG